MREPFKGVSQDALVAAVIGAAFAGAPAAAAAGLTPFAQRMFRLVVDELGVQSGRTESMWQEAAQASGTSAAELFDQAEADQDKRRLAFAASRAAADSLYPPRIVALGRLLAEGLLASDEAVLDEHQFVVDALSEIERPHLRVLRSLVNVEGTRAAPVFVRRQLAWAQLKCLNASYDQALVAITAALERLGLVSRDRRPAIAGDEEGQRTTSAGFERPGAYWTLTDFGYLVLDRLWQAGADDT